MEELIKLFIWNELLDECSHISLGSDPLLPVGNPTSDQGSTVNPQW